MHALALIVALTLGAEVGPVKVWTGAAPTGSCKGTRIVITLTGGVYSCASSTWTLLTSGSSQPYLISEDAGTVAHVYWNGSALIDTKGNTWSMTGTVSMVAASGSTPAGANGFSDSDYYASAVNDLLGTAGTFSACIVYVSTNGGANFIANGSAYGGTGWAILEGSNSKPGFYVNGVMLLETVANSTTMVNVSCMGRNGTISYLKTNLHTIRTVNSANVTNTTVAGVPSKIGRYNAAGGGATSTTIYEVWFSTTTPSDELFTSIETAVQTGLGITWP